MLKTDFLSEVSVDLWKNECMFPKIELQAITS